MTNKEALDYLVIVQNKMHKLSTGHKAIGRAIEALKIVIEAENKPIDARKDKRQVNIPSDEIRAEICDIKDAIPDLLIRVGLLERKAKL